MSIFAPSHAPIAAGRIIYSGLPVQWRDREFLHFVRNGAALDDLAVMRLANLVERYRREAPHVSA